MSAGFFFCPVKIEDINLTNQPRLLDLLGVTEKPSSSGENHELRFNDKVLV